MGKLFQKMYIGNPNKPDLTKEKVASQTRLQLFFHGHSSAWREADSAQRAVFTVFDSHAVFDVYHAGGKSGLQHAGIGAVYLHVFSLLSHCHAGHFRLYKCAASVG